jgi:hypothetical protein
VDRPRQVDIPTQFLHDLNIFEEARVVDGNLQAIPAYMAIDDVDVRSFVGPLEPRA